MRLLHSFPTRRSSDLFLERLGDGGAEVLDLVEPGSLVELALEIGAHAADGAGETAQLLHQGRQFLRPRSEEHTSELQSQSNLVCRLLLEKKKKQTISP